MFSVWLAAGAAAQNPDAGIPKPGAIQGRVIESKSGDPVKKALVTLRQGERDGIATYTDAKGAFSFRDVDPGAYALAAERDGFAIDRKIKQEITNVKAGDTLSDIVIKLVRTGAISGHVVDADSEPVSGVSVQIVPVPEKKGRFGTWALTDDRGEYRAYNIPPGKYKIAATHSNRFDSMHLKLQLAKGESGETESSYATTYHPGTLDSKEAGVIQVDAGSDIHGMDVQLMRLQAVRVMGHVNLPGGATPEMVWVMLQPLNMRTGAPNYNATVQDPSGEFEMAQVLPGTYIASAYAFLTEHRLTTQKTIEVGETDVEGVHLTLMLPQNVTGRIVVPEGRKVPSGLLIMLGQKDHRNNMAGGAAPVRPDGTFSMREVQAGDYEVLISSTGQGDDLYVSSIRNGDHDTLGKWFPTRRSFCQGHRNHLEGERWRYRLLVKNDTGDPAPYVTVALIPDPPRQNQMAFYCECKTDASGACTILGITPGDYHALAIDKENPLDYRDPENSKAIEKTGTAVKIAEGDHQKLELKIIVEEDK